MSSFTDFIRGRKEPCHEIDFRRPIRMTYLLEESNGYMKVGMLKGASTRGSTLTEPDMIKFVLEAVSAAFRIPKEEVSATIDVMILLSPESTDGEICAKRNNLPAR